VLTPRPRAFDNRLDATFKGRGIASGASVNRAFAGRDAVKLHLTRGKEKNIG
jgi:hypothetical protein